MKQVYRVNAHLPPVAGKHYGSSFHRYVTADDFHDAYRQIAEKWPTLKIQCIVHVGELA